MKKSIKKSFALMLSLIMLIVSITTPMLAFAAPTPIKNSSSSVKMSFASWGDPQVSNLMSERGKNASAAAKDLSNAVSKLDALVVAGDITENGDQKEYNEIYGYLSKTKASSYIIAEGNHDVRFLDYPVAKQRFVSFTNKLNANAGSSLKIDKMYYSYSVKGYKFIVVGGEKKMPEESYISNTQLNWLDSQLKSSTTSGKPVFVIMHQPLKDTHGLPNTWGSNNIFSSAGTVGEQSDKIKSILNKYKNVILITAHLHTGFGKYSYQKIGNIHSVNIPSVGIDNQDGYSGAGLGYVAEVFSDKVVFRARDYINGEYVPKHDITIKLDKVKSVKLSATSYTYNGKVKTPSVSVYNYSGSKIPSSNYTVTYPKGRKNVGVYKIKITFKGSYANTPAQYASFKIVPAKTSITKLTAKSKAFNVKIKKQASQTSGYQIQYSTSSKFTNAKTVTLTKNTIVSKDITKLSSKKKYYVRVRTYKTVGKTKIYSAWSSSKSITTK